MRVKIDGQIRDLNEDIRLNSQQKHDISVVVDRLVIKEGIEERIVDSLITCLKLGDGIAIGEIVGEEGGGDNFFREICLPHPWCSDGGVIAATVFF